MLSPAIGLFVTVASAMRKHCRQLDASVEASGPHDFTVRAQCIRRVHRPRPSHPAPNVRDDREAPLFSGTGRGESAFDLPDVTSENACGTLARRANQLRGAKALSRARGVSSNDTHDPNVMPALGAGIHVLFSF